LLENLKLIKYTSVHSINRINDEESSLIAWESQKHFSNQQFSSLNIKHFDYDLTTYCWASFFIWSTKHSSWLNLSWKILLKHMIIQILNLKVLETSSFISSFHHAYQSIFKSTSYKRSITFYLISLLSIKLMMLKSSEI